ncbi:hypothetical protein [Streptomyces sp. F001]|uniref:hypothetical protein n=1 Tax=Streptomyces sp. F001 TaxID=1510026 RepID=UPI001F0DA72D|nr:hypothetical protein [Streptomyces sp. F001]
MDGAAVCPQGRAYQPARGFEPFAVGYVELKEGVRVAAVLDVDYLTRSASACLSW